MFANTLHVEILHFQGLVIIADVVAAQRLRSIAHHRLIHVVGYECCSHKHGVLTHDEVILVYDVVLVQVIVV